jgi:hypothetical protein
MPGAAQSAVTMNRLPHIGRTGQRLLRAWLFRAWRVGHDACGRIAGRGCHSGTMERFDVFAKLPQPALSGGPPVRPSARDFGAALVRAKGPVMISDAVIDRIAERVRSQTFRAANPKSLELGVKGHRPTGFRACPFTGCSIGPAPCRWSLQRRKGATLTTVDGRSLDDFCLGDTASMFGHSPAPLADALWRSRRVRG